MDVWTSFCLALIIMKFEGISSQLRYSVQEELKSGTPVGNVAKDLGLDLGKLADRNLRVVSATKQDLFKVNPRDGVLLINHRVDREELCAKTVPCVTNLKAVVENPLEMHQIMVEILDVNDNSPKFPEENYTLEVLESAIVGSRFQVEGAHDLDVGLNSINSYKLNNNQYFRLDMDAFGEEGKVPFLVLQRSLDREHTPQHWLLLTATDGGKPAKSGTMNITVILSDVNDNAPICDQQKYTATIKENAPVGTFLLTISASDSDEGENGEVEYSLRSKHRGPSSEQFELNSKTGKLTVKGQLDYEEKQMYELKVLASDKGSVSLSTQCNVVIRVEDVNDNQPEIDITSLSSRIPEDAAPGTVVALMDVTDRDSGVNGQVVCSLSDSLPFDLKPSPDGQSYSLITKDYLDKETSHMFNITITAKDLGSPSLSSTKLIQVDVLDVNDNSPLFTESPYTFYVPENNKAGLSIFSVTATDADGGENAAVAYFLNRKSTDSSVISFLNINEADGTISALKSFDFETLKTFQFQVVATDSGTPSLSSNVTVNVFILDQNDNAPVILYPLSSNGSAEGVEEIPRNVNAGHLVTKVRAYDADIGYNGWLLLFGLDRYTGQIRTLRSFTETDEAEHKLVILVKDNGNVSLSASATVIVKLVEPKEAFAASDVKSPAKDDDDDHVTFYLMITLGAVSVLFIISIIVLIAMQCSKSTDYTSKYLQETNYDGTLCHSIQYRSGDKRYMLVGPRMSIGSTIVPGSHANTLKYVTYSFRNERRKTKAPAELLVYSVSEHVGVGSTVGNVGKDLGLDLGTLASRRFRIVSNSNRSLFELNQNNGVLHVAQNLDREELCDGTKVCLINLKIVVESPLEIHYVSVEIIDINDHSPSFPEPEQRLEIAENTPPGTHFQIHAARDPDFGLQSVRLYRLGQNDYFDIQVKESEEDKIPFLVLKKPLDREGKSEHHLVLTALDGGTPSRSGKLNLTITVLDVNDNRPVFSNDIYTVSLNENAPLGTIVIKVNATDSDEGLNGEIEYTFGKTQKKKVYDIFELDSITGEIRVKGKVDFEETEIYRLDLQASDKGQPPWTGESRVVIKLKDFNDNKPEIEITSLSSQIPEDSKPGTVVSLISVRDRDSGMNGKVICKISDNVPFDLTPSVEENMYSLVTKGRLDREAESHYDITITATDCGEPRLSAAKTLQIHVSDINDNRPVFSQNPLEIYLVENNAPGVSIFSITASDKDVNENAAITYNIRKSDGIHAQIKYSIPEEVKVGSVVGNIAKDLGLDINTLGERRFRIVSGIRDGQFEVNQNNGVLYVHQNIDRETLCENISPCLMNLKLVAENPMEIHYVAIEISDINDNTPTFQENEKKIEIAESTQPGRRFQLPTARDPDVAVNTIRVYKLSQNDHFSLQIRDRGDDKDNMYSLVLRQHLDRESVSHYDITITATDSGQPRLSTFKTLSIDVSDTNDNAPQFLYNPVELYLTENNAPGNPIYSVSASDKDLDENSAVSYHLVREEGSQSKNIAFLNVNSENGEIYALKSFDFETLKTFQFQVVATDSGTPSLSSNVTVNVFILDQNDNAPVILYPLSSNSSAEGVEEIPRNVNAGHLVTKVRAYDADIGYNGWLLFSLQEVTDHSLFGLDRYTGQIRTLRSFTETDEAEHKLVILVKDNGNVSLSATATVIVKLVEPKEAFAASDVKSAAKDDEGNDVTFYLMITLGGVSILFIISIIVLIAMQCSKSTDYTSKYLQETNYDGTLCHSIQYRSGDKRYMLVGPRMSIGSTIVPGSHANTLMLPDRRRTSEELVLT
ncbi:hypothetical protein CCH79_00006104 [Gambusia affinis]|uniref:Cadherin domain-containing protein n=1 Tax=Gambusia affinis TaxID=33528 RepID=A0A315VM87_GAMAF|nr:hypothetical protein CCH79_00006104 [Gambusia affinis]